MHRKFTNGTIIKNANVILPHRILPRSSLYISGSSVVSINEPAKTCRGMNIINAMGLYVSPGFIDTHIHGSPERIFQNELKYGTTSILVAISCDSLKNIFQKVDSIRSFMTENTLGPNVLGVRLEGPYINPVKSGAQNRDFIKRPDKNELESIIKRCGNALRIMTIAPEVPGVLPLIKILKRHRVISSIGHSNASYRETVAGIDAGITHATHLFNAMRGIGKTSPGAAAAILSDKRVTAEVISDMIHVPSARFILAAAVKGPDKIVMVTDSIAADVPEGAWKENGAYWIRKDVKAGSALTMIDAVRNAVRIAGLSLADAVRLATANPAKLLGVEDRKGAIAVGRDADLVIFDRNFDVKMVIVRGKIALEK